MFIRSEAFNPHISRVLVHMSRIEMATTTTIRPLIISFFFLQIFNVLYIVSEYSMYYIHFSNNCRYSHLVSVLVLIFFLPQL